MINFGIELWLKVMLFFKGVLLFFNKLCWIGFVVLIILWMFFWCLKSFVLFGFWLFDWYIFELVCLFLVLLVRLIMIGWFVGVILLFLVLLLVEVMVILEVRVLEEVMLVLILFGEFLILSDFFILYDWLMWILDVKVLKVLLVEVNVWEVMVLIWLSDGVILGNWLSLLNFFILRFVFLLYKCLLGWGWFRGVL